MSISNSVDNFSFYRVRTFHIFLKQCWCLNLLTNYFNILIFLDNKKKMNWARLQLLGNQICSKWITFRFVGRENMVFTRCSSAALWYCRSLVIKWNTSKQIKYFILYLITSQLASYSTPLNLFLTHWKRFENVKCYM